MPQRYAEAPFQVLWNPVTGEVNLISASGRVLDERDREKALGALPDREREGVESTIRHLRSVGRWGRAAVSGSGQGA